jgi:outer membrane protease
MLKLEEKKVKEIRQLGHYLISDFEANILFKWKNSFKLHEYKNVWLKMEKIRKIKKGQMRDRDET